MTDATAARRPRSWSPSSPARCSSTPTARRRSTSTFRSSTAPCASWRSPGPRTRVGHATSDVIVRDPVVVTASLPRFLAPGDKAQLRLDIANTDGPAGDYTLALDTDRRSLDRRQPTRTSSRSPPGKRQTLTVPISADQTGDAGDHHPARLVPTALTRRADRCRSRCVRRSLPVTTRIVVNLGRQRRQPDDRPASCWRPACSTALPSASASRSRRPSTCRRC